MSNQVFANGVQLGTPSPARPYVSTETPFSFTVLVIGPAGAITQFFNGVDGASTKTFSLQKYTVTASSASTSWTSVVTLPAILWPLVKQTFVVPIIVNAATVPGYLEVFPSGAFSIATSLTPSIGQVCGWEDITISYL